MLHSRHSHNSATPVCSSNPNVLSSTVPPPPSKSHTQFPSYKGPSLGANPTDQYSTYLANPASRSPPPSAPPTNPSPSPSPHPPPTSSSSPALFRPTHTPLQQPPKHTHIHPARYTYPLLPLLQFPYHCAADLASFALDGAVEARSDNVNGEPLAVLVVEEEGGCGCRCGV